MNLKSFRNWTAGLFVTGSMVLGLNPTAAQGQSSPLFQPEPEVSYQCMMSPENVPTTYARMNGGTQNVPVIRWKSEYFGGSGWHARNRCLEVSSRFQAFKQADQLRYLIPSYAQSVTGTWYPVICTNTDSDSNRCGGLLITLELGENPNTVLEEMQQAGKEGTPITRSADGSISIDLDVYIRTVRSEQNVRPIN